MRASFNKMFGRKSETGSLSSPSYDVNDPSCGGPLATPPMSPTMSQKLSGNGFYDNTSSSRRNGNGNGHGNGNGYTKRDMPRSPSGRTSTRGSIDTLLGLSDIDKKTLALQRKVVFVKKPRGDCIVRKGDPVKYVYVMLSGLVMVFRSGNNYADYSIGPGDCIGEESFGDAVSVKTYRAANDVHYCEVDREMFVKSDLFAAFRVRMDSDSKFKQRFVASPSSATSSAFGPDEEGRERPQSEAGTGIASVFFIGPLGSMCNIGPFASQPVDGGSHTDMYDVGADHERTPRTKKQPDGAIPWCFIPQFLMWT